VTSEIILSGKNPLFAWLTAMSDAQRY